MKKSKQQKDIDEAKSALRSKRRKRVPFKSTDLLSTGSTLHNLALSGKTNGGVEKGSCVLDVGDSDSGKAQPLSAKVLTVNGFKLMGQIKKGDELIDPCGGTCKVTGVFPQGMKEVFEIEFSDGSKTQCCKEHLWKVNPLDNGHRRTGWKVLSLEEISKNLYLKDETPRYRIPMMEPAQTELKRDLPVHPYLLGVVLGNGLICKRRVSIASCEAQIISRLKLLVASGLRLAKRTEDNYDVVLKSYDGVTQNDIKQVFRSLGLEDHRSHEKFIPGRYLNASLHDRIELLHGLMDTDGTVTKNAGNTAIYYTTSEKLKNGVVKLVRSLGGTVTTSLKEVTSYKYKGEIRPAKPCHIISIRLPFSITAFRLKRKAKRFRSVASGKMITPFRDIVNVKKIGKEECQCISVDSKERTYVTDDYIVTHNTWRGVTFLAEAAANESFEDYRLIFDKTNEDGTKIDIEFHFGKKLAKRIEPPGKSANGEEVHSTTIEEMFDFIDDAYRAGKPFIYVGDSIDAVTTEAELKKDAENKKLRRKAKSAELAKTKGSMGDGKAKLISSKLRQAMPKIQKTGSILILLNQAKDAVGDMTFGYGPKPKARAGGKSPVYYSQVQYWSEKGADLKKEFKGKKVSVGNIIKIDVKRTRYTGRRTSIQYPIYWNAGIDDVGSCINFLIDWAFWEGNVKSGNVKAPEFDFKGKIDDLISHIEENDLEKNLRTLVKKHWYAIEEAVAVNRKKRYE